MPPTGDGAHKGDLTGRDMHIGMHDPHGCVPRGMQLRRVDAPNDAGAGSSAGKAACHNHS